MKLATACMFVVLWVSGAVYSCPSPSYLRRVGGSSLCARMYQHSSCRGGYLNANKGSFNSNVGGHWNDKISSFVVLPGCELQVYEHDNFNGADSVSGHHSRYGGVTVNLGSWWNDRISSFICTCRNYKK